MAKRFRDDEDCDEGRPPCKGHRNRSRSRRSEWSDPEPAHFAVLPPPAPKHAAACGEIGTVRFFEPAKGFGFVAPLSGPDLFVHATVVRRAGLETLAAGQAVRFERGPGRQPGKEAVLRIEPA